MTTHSCHSRTSNRGTVHADRDTARDPLFDAFATTPRRRLVRRLADAPGPVSVADLAAELATDADEEARIASRLHHAHLPALSDAGIAAYDDRTWTATYRPTRRVEAVWAAVAAVEDVDHPLDLDAVFDLLANRRRRRTLATLSAHGDVSLPDLADEVVVAERERPLAEVDPHHVLAVYLALYHAHVPALADAGLVAYDQDSDYVTVTDDAFALEPVLRALSVPADG